jgi:hypothetical protein
MVGHGMTQFIAAGILLLAALAGVLPRASRAEEPRSSADLHQVGGDAVIRSPVRDTEIRITTTGRLAGAIHSLQWNGREFIDSYDHGRQMQSAISLDCGTEGEFWPECFNPTEAGARSDGTGPSSSSRLLALAADRAELTTTTQMAFWLAPGEQSYGRLALNRERLSNYRLTKRVQIGVESLDQVIQYDVSFSVPNGERHTLAQFEALTAYLPPYFSQFWKFLPATGQLEPLDDGPGEQSHPVVFADPSGDYAIGVIADQQIPSGVEGPSYGRFRFDEERVVKWNCVFRRATDAGIAAGDYDFRLFVAVGTLEDVRKSLIALTECSRNAGESKTIYPSAAVGASDSNRPNGWSVR